MKANALGCLTASILPRPPSFVTSRHPRNAAKRAGLRFEVDVLEWLLLFAQRHNYDFQPSPWFTYSMPSPPFDRFCQPDALLIDLVAVPRRLIIVEIKLTHCIDAWFQTELLYRPVAAAALRANGAEPNLPIFTMEICRNLGAAGLGSAMAAPAGIGIELLRSPAGVVPGKFNVLHWPSRERFDAKANLSPITPGPGNLGAGARRTTTAVAYDCPAGVAEGERAAPTQVPKL